LRTLAGVDDHPAAEEPVHADGRAPRAAHHGGQLFEPRNGSPHEAAEAVRHSQSELRAGTQADMRGRRFEHRDVATQIVGQLQASGGLLGEAQRAFAVRSGGGPCISQGQTQLQTRPIDHRADAAELRAAFARPE
jgi:hypothetical protein